MVNVLRLSFTVFFWLLATMLAFPGPAEACDRSAFGSYVQRDYKDTRARVLEARATDAVTFRIGGGKRLIVQSGTWKDEFTGTLLVNVPATRVQIDHVLPVCWVWERGAQDWSREKRRAFYNDPRYLMVVERGLNAVKGDSGPDEFLPPNRDLACNYVETFLGGVDVFEVRLRPGERATFETIREATCGAAGS
jgi:hypothetical protein